MHSKPVLPLVAAAFLATAAIAPAFGGSMHSATVLETMDGGGYTYVKVDEDGAVYWAAAPATQVAVGDQVSFTEQMKMQNFTSRSLNRTFDELLFVGSLDGGSGAGTPAASAPEIATSPVAAAPVEPMEKAEGGYTIAEVFAGKQDLKGETVRVRGKVVKVSPNIMGLTWVHLEDGTGDAGSDRLIFRSAADSAEVGAVVTAQGTVDTDQDFGFGYQYSVLVNDASFTQ
jgi:hypothetical protein